VNFLNSLAAAERQALTAVGLQRTFASGAKLMREGDQADYVMVILSGWTMITVYEGGAERVVAERGPGQLVGERGALHVSWRSATVVALGTVHALVMKTEDFASFISAHPRVLDVVENQIYDRLTEEPMEPVPGDGAAEFPVVPARQPVAGPPRRQSLDGENCTVLLTDVVGFGAHSRNDRDRQIIRREDLAMLRASLGSLWDACISEDRGDGLLIVAPPQIPTARIMGRLHRELPGKLRQHNRTYAEPARIRMRVAVNVGPVMTDSLGMSGEAIIRTARLVEAPALKVAMASTAASLGLIVSPFVYETAIRHSDEFIDLAEYAKVEVALKEFRSAAWMRLA
jgi:hypothetical protein